MYLAPGLPTPRTDGPHACYQHVLFVTKEKGRPVLTLHTGLLLKGGGGGVVLKKARITKEKGRPVLTLHTGLFAEKGGGVAWNTHMRTLNNTEWGGGAGI